MLKTCLKPMLAAISLAVFLSPAASAKDKKRQEAEALLARARELSDIRCEGCPPFRLLVRLTLREADGGFVGSGHFEETWEAREKWRRSIELGGEFRQTRVRLNGRVWDTTTTTYDPYPISLVRATLGVGSYPGARQEERITKIREASYNGMPVAVIEIRSNYGKARVYISRKDSRPLRREDELEEMLRVRENSDFRQHGEKFYPFLMTFKAGDRLLVEAKIESLSVLPQIPEIHPPQNAISWPACEEPNRPRPLRIPDPPYPAFLRGRGGEGRIFLYIVVGLDGRVYNTSPILGTDRELAAHAVETISKGWRFEPGMCGNEPVPASTTVIVNFRVR